jgi:hypothetical protein
LARVGLRKLRLGNSPLTKPPATCTRGLDIDAVGNIIIGNTCAGNFTRNWDIVAGNNFGPIVNVSPSGAAAVSGDSAPSTLGSTDPNANFTY